MQLSRSAVVVASVSVLLGCMTTAAVASGGVPLLGSGTSTTERHAATSSAPPSTSTVSRVASLPPVPAPTTTIAPTTVPPAPSTSTTPTVPRPASLAMAPDSVPASGWFHLVGRTAPRGTAQVRYRNVHRAVQVAVADHAAGPLSLWLRAPGPPGSAITIDVEALDASGAVLADLGTVTLTTGDAMLPLPHDSGFGRRMVVSSDAQQIWLVGDDGAVIDTFLMSGRRVPTESGADQVGLFTVYSRSGTMRYCEERCGTAQYMVRYQRTPTSAVGTHSLPTEGGLPVQGVDDLGWPLSHGCSRLEVSKAREVFRFATVGTLVVVL